MTVTDLIDTTEMYLRTIFELEEEGIVPLRARIAERLGHSGPTVSQTVARMERDGLVAVSGDRHLELSDHGRLLATRVMRKHRLAERLLLGVIGEGLESPYGNPIPGLDELGVRQDADFLTGLSTLAAAVGDAPAVVTIRRIGEPVQVDPEALALLTSAGVVPGAQVSVVRDGARVVAVREGSEPSSGVSLPYTVAVHVFCQAR